MRMVDQEHADETSHNKTEEDIQPARNFENTIIHKSYWCSKDFNFHISDVCFMVLVKNYVIM